MAAERQAVAQFAVVIQLTVKYDRNVFGFVPDGLMAAGQVDDAQPTNSQSEAGRARFAQEKSFLVRAAVTHGCGHCLHARFRLGIAYRESDSADAAHATV